MASDSFKLLAQGQVGTSFTVVTVTSGKSWIISYFSVVNIDTSAGVTLKICIDGQTDADIWVPEFTLGAEEKWEFESGAGLCLDSTKTIDMIAGTASKLNYVITGDEYTP